MGSVHGCKLPWQSLTRRSGLHQAPSPLESPLVEGEARSRRYCTSRLRCKAHVSLVMHPQTAPASSGAQVRNPKSGQPRPMFDRAGFGRGRPVVIRQGAGNLCNAVALQRLPSTVTGTRCRDLGTHASTAARRRCGATTLAAAIVATCASGERRDALNHHRGAAPYAAAHLRLNDGTTPSSAGMRAGNCPIGTEPPSPT